MQSDPTRRPSMRAVVIREPGGPEVLVLRDVPMPEPPPSFVRVAVRHAGVNRADLLQRLGVYPAPPGVPPDIPGLEYAGVVDALGEGVTRFAIGDRVCGLLGGGAYAERIVAHEGEVARVPAAVDDVTAGATPEVLVTAYDALLIRAGLAPGETVLIHAGGSGVGTAAVQLAKALGCFVIVTSRTEDKIARCKELGADVALVVQGASFERAVREATSGRGADVVLDLVGGAYVAEDVLAAATLGRIVVVGLTAGTRADVDLRLLLAKRVTITGTVLRSRPLAEKIRAAEVLERHALPLVASGRVRPIVDRVLPLSEAAAAHAYLASNASFGKVLLEVAPAG
jgi:NADPH2:quinone reductase